jgi:hypothetical protein
MCMVMVKERAGYWLRTYITLLYDVIVGILDVRLCGTENFIHFLLRHDPAPMQRDF